MRIASVLSNDNPCTYLSDDGTTFDYEFTMPEQDVTIAVTLEIDYHAITPLQGEHTTLAILNCHFNFGTPEHLIQGMLGELVRYTATAEIGYDLVQTVEDESGTPVPYAWIPHDPDYGACWRFVMPDLPVSVTTEAVEKEDYAGMAFVGDYKGCELDTPESLIATGDHTSMSMQLKANTVFAVQSTDRNAFSFDGCYLFDEATGKFSYVRETCKKTYAMEGNLLGDDLVFVRVRNILDDKPDNNRIYFTSKSDFNYVCASDPWKTKFLLEIDRQGKKSYYYYASWTCSEVDIRFDEGSSIGSASSALVSLDGAPLFRYTLESAGATPVFRYLGSEAGQYAPSEGSGPLLTLDGFGTGSVGDTQGTYTIEAGIVTFTAGDTVTKYLIDPLRKTYYEVKSEIAWDGPPSFSGQTPYAYNPNVSSDWITGEINVEIDRNMSGEVKERYAAIRISVQNEFYRTENYISDCVPYIYEHDTGTLVLSQVLQGKSDSWGQERRDISFTVSSDKQALTFVTDYIYSLTNPNKYVYTEGLELTPSAN